jgi:uncharacterized damage-inducible protein DinB
MFATADEPREEIVSLFKQGAALGHQTIAALPLDAPGFVPWWRPGKQEVTLGQILVHLIAEVHRHAGQVDILREQIDGFAGWKEEMPLMDDYDDDGPAAYVARLQEIAETFR